MLHVLYHINRIESQGTIKNIGMIFKVFALMLSVILCFASIHSNASEIYKYRDKNGVLHFSDAQITTSANEHFTNDIEILQGRDASELSTIEHISRLTFKSLDEPVFSRGYLVKQKPKKKKKPKRRYSTTVHKGFDLQFGINRNSKDYVVLDGMISKISMAVKRKEVKTMDDAEKLLKKMDDVINRYGGRFVSEGFTARVCRKAVLYVAMGEVLGYPIRAVMTPNHIHVRYYLNENSYFNWETILGKRVPDQDYVRNKNIHSITIRNGVHLKSLSSSELYGYFHDWAGRAYIRKAKYDEAIEMLDKGARLYNQQPYIYRDLAYAWAKKHDYAKALTNIDKALDLDPYNEWNKKFRERISAKQS